MKTLSSNEDIIFTPFLEQALSNWDNYVVLAGNENEDVGFFTDDGTLHMRAELIIAYLHTHPKTLELIMSHFGLIHEYQMVDKG